MFFPYKSLSFALNTIACRFLPRKIEQRFREIIQDTLQYRKEYGIARNDYLSILSGIKENGGKYDFRDDDILAHSLGFFLDGFETSSISLSFTLYELGANKFAQDKLKEEIDRVLLKYNNELTYEAVQDMEYLDCVINGKFNKYQVLETIVISATYFERLHL